VTTGTLLFFLVAGGVAVVIFRLLRSGRLREKYAGLWILVGTSIVALVIWPHVLESITGWLGVQVPANLLFFLAIFLLLGVSLHLSLEISKLEDETRILAEEVAILRLDAERRGGAASPPPQGANGA